MITISYDLLFKILYIIISLIHFIVYAIIFRKFRKLSNRSAPTFTDLLKTVKNGANKVLDYFAPQFPNIIGLIKTLTDGEKKDNEEGKKNG